MKIDYDTLYAVVRYQDDDIVIYDWGCNIGFGELVINAQNGNIIDDENMGKEFALKVIEKAKEMK